MGEKDLSKFAILISLIKIISFIVGINGLTPDKETWTYELKSIETKSSDPDKLKINLHIERVSRGVYAISGGIFVNFDITEGDSNKIAAKSYRSANGDSDYKILPFQMTDSHIYKVINTHYKNILMDTLKTCSDLPNFEDKFQPPLEKREYTLNSCQFSQDGLPNHLQDGFYKIIIIGSGEVDWQIEVIAEITSNF